ncbi:putative CocE/NonD family hydrolase [Variovorax paradoxus]|uniref:CocE/NonD family hydrolase n=1 Tax=Variovorax paradoxus TaxID=34073 RepID=UPI0027924F68|nr:CocE/NonD family hydrolase [Variovorax paradoxus]MDQ0569503.1 putative CocE/NonD family hydrolase [Variovorax paradoxus]
MRHRESTFSRARRVLTRLVLALPVWSTWSWAADFGFRPPRDPDDATAADLMRDLAERILPVYQEADTDVFLANLTALQIVSGAYRAASDSSGSLRSRRQGKPFDDLVQRAILDGIYARARALEADGRLGFAEAYARAFQELVSPLDNLQAQAIMSRLEIPAAAYREPLRQAFDLWRAKGSLPEADALALVRTWHSYQSRRSFGALLPELFAAENRARYVAEGDVTIPVRGGVIHASLVRPGRTSDALPTLLRFTLDPAEDDAQRSAAKGYVGVTAYVRGRTPDGNGAVWPFVRDGEDAAAVIDWIARQAWSDGRVCMIGDGYSGYAAWAAARLRPAALKAIATIAPMAPGIDFPMAGQIFRNAMVRWAQEHANAEPLRADADASPDATWQALDARWYRGNRPYWDIDRVLIGKRSRLIRTWLTHPSHDRYWQKFLPSAQQFARIDIPVLSFAGYYGADAGALYFHDEHRRNRPQADTTLLLGPYDAASIRLGTAPTLRGYTLDPVARVDLPELRLQWLDHVLKGANKPSLLMDRVNYQVMGADQWRHVPTRDAPQRTGLRFYLDTRERDDPHRLLASPSEGGGSARLSVDLADRRDVRIPWPDALRVKQLPTRNGLSFVSEPLSEDIEIFGSLRGVFDITPSRQDVDFSVSLYEQTDSGEYQLLFDPYDFRASYAGHRVRRRLLRAGERQLLAFTAERVTARRLAAGSRIVLLIALNKRPDRQINYGSGKDVNSETVADAKWPVRVRWHARSYIEIQTGKP